jgi:hypothetical protein
MSRSIVCFSTSSHLVEIKGFEGAAFLCICLTACVQGKSSAGGLFLEELGKNFFFLSFSCLLLSRRFGENFCAGVSTVASVNLAQLMSKEDRIREAEERGTAPYNIGLASHDDQWLREGFERRQPRQKDWNFEEYREWAFKREKHIRHVFADLDKDGNGLLTPDEVALALNLHVRKKKKKRKKQNKKTKNNEKLIVSVV